MTFSLRSQITLALVAFGIAPAGSWRMSRTARPKISRRNNETRCARPPCKSACG